MKILITNDDGINAAGLHALTSTLTREEGTEIYISAPHEQKSAAGHSISVRGKLIVQKEEFDGVKDAISVTGTPADCVKIAIAHYAAKGIQFDMLFSGINHGGNLGTDTLYSGTVGAAMEGSFNNIPSVAVSVDSHLPGHFDYACELVRETYRAAAGKLPPDVILNLNIPNEPREKIKGLIITKLGMREYDEWFSQVEDEEGREAYKYEGNPVHYDSDDLNIDVIAMQEGYASITPLGRFLTNESFRETLREWYAEENKPRIDIEKIRKEMNNG